ncbi:cell division protein ZapE [Zhihengliuella salsuginis]|uniref:Cell division protein ZapE n=1 Tax=Zhihengliuella salsuginis TaxID=578222 RepID=A0ABQ3GI30_9MICC|nr:cell division protein ZapE [Zhihengliuella salsuginis]GHD05064.1 cell division protein ZapE [Zhihengliuella salsuginis]
MQWPGQRPHLWPGVDAADLVGGLEAGGRTLDPGQRSAVEQLTAPHARGVYLFGGVGRGKTWMADACFAAAPGPKRRVHMHSFLAEINAAVAARADPAAEAIAGLVGEARFLFIDEFHVHDVGDAMLIRRLLDVLLRARIGLVATSNYAPEDLLPNPLFHHHMLPAIEQIRAHLAVVEVVPGTDYRVAGSAEGGFAAGAWTAAPGDGARPAGRRDDGGRGGDVVVLGSRTVPVRAADAGRGVLSGTFAQLCEAPLSAADYVTLASRYSRWELTDVPGPGEIDEQGFQRFAHLVDVLVDAQHRLDVTAGLPLEQWAEPGGMPRDAARFLSRLSLLRS